jgi:hypothetical protein
MTTIMIFFRCGGGRLGRRVVDGVFYGGDPAGAVRRFGWGADAAKPWGRPVELNGSPMMRII